MQQRNSRSGSRGSLTHSAANTEVLSHRGIPLRPENAFISLVLDPRGIAPTAVDPPVRHNSDQDIQRLDKQSGKHSE